MTARLRSAAFWLLPPLFCLWLYWYGLLAWFQQDDFAWLGLRLQVHSWHDLLHALFAPMAQGSIRPWSERLFFMAFSALFGIDALPFRLWVFLTQFANLALLGSLTRRLTGSWLAGLLAPLLWTANAALSVPLSWTSAYNQVLCAFFLLLAFHLFVRWTETGRRRTYYAQVAVFVLGFGSLELNVVYPALAAAYALARARHSLWRTAPLFALSGIYAVIHRSLAPAQTAAVYRMHWDASLFATFWQYWQWALAPARLPAVHPVPAWFVPAATAVLTAALLGFAAWRAVRRDWLGCFFLAWFLLVLAPLLPLRDHLTEYYLSIPTIGLAALAAWALSSALRKHWIPGLAAAAAGILYLASSLPVARAVARWHFDRGRAVQTLALGVARAHQLHPGKLILVNGVTNELFWAGVYDRPFRLFGAQEVYLTPGSETAIEAHPELGPVSNYVLSTAVARRALDRDQAVVYQAGGPRLKNITAFYRDRVAASWTLEPPRFLDAGQPLFADLLGPEWYPAEGAYRWMPQRATLRMGAPRTPAEKLYLVGYCAAEALAPGPLKMTVTISGLPVSSFQITHAGEFTQPIALPAPLLGKPDMQVALALDRTFSPPHDPRALGVAFGTFSLR